MKTQVIPPPGPSAYLQPGEIVAERYRLERELGRGSMGVVWAAIHVTLGQRVAIKLISAGQIDSPETRHRFSTEAKAAARLKSRHAVQVYDDGQTLDGTPYIVMEYLEGETLEEKLERGALALPEAVRITSHVCRALSRAHAQGIIHRDLKPANIFIARAEDDEYGWLAKVLDFGVAKIVCTTDPSHTKTGTLVGTPLFMSPEQVRGASQVDARADLYSLGMVFYNMVTGHFAFDAPSYSDVLVNICLGPPPTLSGVSGIPDSVRAWFEKACAREPGERFQSAEEMSEALRAAAGELPRERLSLPEEVLGPSGTVMGYGSPDVLELSPAPGERPALVADRGPNGTLKSNPLPENPASPLELARVPVARRGVDPLPVAEPLEVEGRPRRSSWPLWLAAGAGLGLTLAGGGTLLFLAGSADPPSPPPERATLAVAEPREVPPAPTNPAPMAATIAPPSVSSAPLALGAPSASAPAKLAAPQAVRTAAKRPIAVTPPRVASEAPVLPASKAPPAKSEAPDIGF